MSMSIREKYVLPVLDLIGSVLIYSTLVGSGRTLVTYVAVTIFPSLYIIRLLTFCSSTVVQHMIDKYEDINHLVAHFFYSYSNRSRLIAADLFKSYIKQILGYFDMTGTQLHMQIISCIKRFYGESKLA